MPKTAAIIVIGDEILSGKVQDANSHFLAAELRALGVDVRRVIVIPDELDAVAREVSAASEAYDYVFTSGGVGPTHDDVTMEAIARGFGLGTEPNPVILQYLRGRCGERLNSAAQKMANLPKGAELLDVEGPFPPVRVRNVYILPGVPGLLRKKFHQIKERFRSRPYVLRKVFLNEEECYVARHLDKVVREFPDVMVGSYPMFDNSAHKVVVTLESREPDRLRRAFEKLMSLLPKEIVAGTE